MKEKTAFISADYEEYNIETYKGMFVTLGRSGKVIFRSHCGDAKEDLSAATEFAYPRADRIIEMSSVCHYFMDSQPDEDIHVETVSAEDLEELSDHIAILEAIRDNE